MKKFKKNTLTVLAASFLAMSLSLTSCFDSGEGGGGGGGGTEDTEYTLLKLAEDLYEPQGEGTTFFAPFLKRENGQYANSKDAALVKSGEKLSLATYGLPKDYKVGFRVEDLEGKEVEFAVAEDGSFTVPTVTTETTYNVFVFGVKEGASTVKKKLQVTAIPANQLQTGWTNLSGKNGEEREKMTAAIEEYMYNQGLSPVTYMSNAGYSLYASRLHTPFLDQGVYIPGYGYGLLTYGTIDAPMAAEDTEGFKMFLHDQEDADNDEGNFNALASNAGAVSDFYDYVAASYFGTFVNQDNKGTHYEGVLSRADAPVAINPDENGASTTWKILLRVGGDTENASKGVFPGMAYRTASENAALASFNNRNIQLKDYLTPFKLLATQAVGWFRGGEQAAESTANRQVKGFAEFYSGSKNLTELPTDAEIQQALGVKIDESDNSITITFNGKVTPDYIEYQIDGLWANPISEEFLRALGGGNALEGSKKYGISAKLDGADLTPLDTLLSVGPYYTSFYQSKKTVAFAKNANWPKKKDNAQRDLYRVPGVHLNLNSNMKDETELIKKFEAGLTDTSNIPSDYWDKYISDARRKKVDASGLYQWFLQTMDKQFHDQRFPESQWEVKPVMSNNNFYKGLITGFDRQGIAEYYHRSGTAFEMQEPINKSTPKSQRVYNATDVHNTAIANSMGNSLSDPSKWKETGADYFELAIQEELDAGHYKLGTADKPEEIKINLISTDGTSYAKRWQLISEGWVEAFDLAVKSHRNADGVNDWVSGDKPLIKFVPTVKAEKYASSSAMQGDIIDNGVQAGNYDGQCVYYVSGNPYDVLNNIEKYKADNSGSFTLNYGPDTSLPAREIKYDGKYYSFEGLWAAANGGKILSEDGVPVAEFAVGEKPALTYVNATEIDVTLDFSYQKQYVKNIKWYADAMDAEGEEDYTPLETVVDEAKGTITLKFKGDQLIDLSPFYGPDYAGLYYIEPLATYDFEVGGEKIEKEWGNYWFIPQTKPAQGN